MRCLATFVFAGLVLQAAEYAHFKNGTRLEIEKHETEGSSVFLYAKSGIQIMDASEVVKFEKILPPGAEAPQPAATKSFRPLPGVDTNGKAYQLIDAAATRHGVPAELLHAVAAVESAHRQDVQSRSGAIGIMQLMPETARYFGVNPRDAAQNVDAGTRFLRELLIKYEKNPDQIALVLAAYNAGPNAVERFGGVPPYQETQLYVEKVIERYLAQGKE